MTWSACRRSMVIAVLAEFLLTVLLEVVVVPPGTRGLCFIGLAMVAPMTVLAVFIYAAMMGPRGARSSSGSRRDDTIQPWMRSNMYFNSQENHRDLDRLTQLAEEHAMRDLNHD